MYSLHAILLLVASLCELTPLVVTVVNAFVVRVSGHCTFFLCVVNLLKTFWIKVASLFLSMFMFYMKVMITILQVFKWRMLNERNYSFHKLMKRSYHHQKYFIVKKSPINLMVGFRNSIKIYWQRRCLEKSLMEFNIKRLLCSCIAYFLFWWMLYLKRNFIFRAFAVFNWNLMHL